MKRITIFVIFQKDEHLPEDVLYLIKELRTISDKLIIVINGYIYEQEIIERESDYLIIRDNVGFDAGAYKEALNNRRIQQMIKDSDELVLCNDTFYGPFVPFVEIFKKMQKKECDFWGLSLIDKRAEVILQSNFLVFREKLVRTNILREYFNKYLDEKTTDFNEILRLFERNLFNYLIMNKYTYSFYRRIITLRKAMSVNFQIASSVIFEKVPILRKKAFAPEWFCKESILNALCYINNNYRYPIKLILEDIKNRYGLTINESDFLNRNLKIIKREEVPCINDVKKHVLNFVQSNNPVFLYGTGKYAQDVIKIIGIDNIAGFIVSDDHIVNDYFFNKKIIKFSEIKDKLSLPIIVALGYTNTWQVRNKLNNFDNILFLWEFKNNYYNKTVKES